MSHATTARRFPLRIIRGGSSKGIFLRDSDVPPPGPDRDARILRLFGTPDVRQIDGLGGGDKLTSKLAIMGSPTRPDCDVSYLFGQVGTMYPDIDWTSNCGNISAGAALHGALDGAGIRRDNAQILRIEQRNTGRVLLARVPMCGDAPALEGGFEIGGVPGTGPRIDLDFADFTGSSLNRGLFPTGSRTEELHLDGDRHLPVTIIDIANLSVIVSAADLGIDTGSSLAALQADAALLARLDAIRAAVVARLDLNRGESMEVFLRRSVNPLLHIVAPPTGYTDLNARFVGAGAQEIWSRSYARGAFSKAFPGSGAVGLAVAACLPGTIACAAMTRQESASHVRIGHPGGVLTMEVGVSGDAEAPTVSTAVLGRTARLLLEGHGFA